MPAATVKMTKHMTPRELNNMTGTCRESVQGGGGGRGDAETAMEMGCGERGYFCMRVVGRELASCCWSRGVKKTCRTSGVKFIKIHRDGDSPHLKLE